MLKEEQIRDKLRGLKWKDKKSKTSGEFISCFQTESYPKRDYVQGENEIGHSKKPIPRERLRCVIKADWKGSHVGNNTCLDPQTG